MTAEIIPYTDAREQQERDRKVFRFLIEGKSAREIADELKCSISDVHGAQHRMCSGVTPEFKQRVLEVEVARLEALHQVFFKKAEEGDTEAANWCIRRADRMAKFLGLDVLPRGDTSAGEPREPTRYQKITEAVMRLRGGPVIEGEVVKDGSVPGGS